MSDEPEELNSQGILDSSVVALDDHRPHTAGTARCAGTCQHEWVAVAPERRRTDNGLECPSCHRMDGYYLFSEGEFRQWLCNVALLLDGWHGDGTAWSEWDESIRADCPRAHVTLDALTPFRTPQPPAEQGELLRILTALQSAAYRAGLHDAKCDDEVDDCELCGKLMDATDDALDAALLATRTPQPSVVPSNYRQEGTSDARAEAPLSALEFASPRLWQVANRAKLTDLGLIEPMMEALQEIDAAIAAAREKES